MNHIFRLVWNAATSQVIPVSELCRCGRLGRTSRRNAARGAMVAARSAVLLLLGQGFCGYSQANPSGDQITTGSGQVTQTGTTTTIRQNSPTLGLNWASFDVAANETVNFVQPGSGALAVNRILSSNGSDILGHVNANGQVWLINPNGILFGRDSQINVAGLVASTLEPTGSGGTQSSFGGGGTGSIVNQGTLTAAKGGYVALLGNSVINQGVIAAQLGTVALGAGSAATLTFAGNKLLQLQVDQSTLGNLADNRGLIAAEGGTVYLTAGAMNSVLASSVNTSGVIRANTFENHDGVIVLSAGLPAGEVTVGGTLDVSSADGVGGVVTATAGTVTVGAGASIDASGGAGGGAIRIGGGWEGGEGLAQATTASVAAGATLDASATGRGNGGEVVVRSDISDASSTTQVGGTLLAKGGPQGGDGGRIETSGHWLDVTGITADTAATTGAAGLWLLDPYNVTIGATGTNVSSSGGTYQPSSDSTITASSINTALQNGNNVTISTYNAGGGSIGDIIVSSPITKASGSTNVTLTLQAADTIVVNAPISNNGGTGKLNVNLYADSNNGTHDGVGVIILNNSITTGGGNIAFGTGATMSVNGVTTQVGGDLYVGPGSTVNLTTAGGNVSIYGQLIIANSGGLTVDTNTGAATTAGNVLFNGTIDSGDTYALISSFGSNGSVTWTSALTDAKSGTGGNIGDTYLATITSRLENSVASYYVNYTQSWLGGARVFNLGTDAVWRWVTGPEGLTNNGNGLPFFTQNGCDTNNCSPFSTGFNGGTAYNGAYTNWNPGTPEPNNYAGTSLNQAGSGEWTLQFVGTQGQWNDLNPTGHVLPFTQETNLAYSPLTVNAGSTGTVTLNGAIGANKPLSTLTVSGQITGLPANPTINTTGPVIFNGVVQINNVVYNVLIVTAPSVTTTYGATLPTLTPTYSGFVSGDTVASLTTLATATTTGSTAYISTAPIIASGAADATNPTRYYFLYDPGLLTVNPAPVTVTGTTVATRAYNGGTAATLTGGILNGVFSYDTANVTLVQAGTFAQKDAASGIAVTASDSLTGSAANDYTLTQPTGLTGTITPLALTVTGTSVTPKVYDGTTTATLAGGVLNGVANGDTGLVSLTQAGSFASKNAASGIAVTAADTLNVTGSATGDYTLTQPTGLTGTISPKPITVNGSTGVNKAYDGTTALASSVTGYTNPTGFIGGDSVTVTGSPVYASADAGLRALIQGSVAFTGPAAGNYSVSWVNGSGTISPVPLTVTANADARFVGQNDTVGFGGVSYQGFVDGQTSGVLGGTLAITRSNAGTGAAGTYTGVLVPSGLTSTDYTISYVPGNYTIVPAGSLLIRATNITTTYGTAPGYAISSVQYLNGSNVLLTLTQTGVTGSTYGYTDGVGGTATFTLGATGALTSSSGNLAVGNYAIGDYGFASTGANFTGTPVIVGELTVNPLGISASAANPPSKIYDGTTSMAATSIALSGVLAGDAVTGSGIGTFASKNAGTGLAYTLSGLALTGADAQDYYLTNGVSAVGTNGSITPLAVAVTGVSAAGKTYDGTTTASLTGTPAIASLGGDQVSVSSGSVQASFQNASVGQGKAVTVTGYALSGADAQDYSVTQPTGLTASITAAPLTLTGTETVTPKTYDGTTVATLSGGILSGLAPVDQGLVSLQGTYASANAGSHIAVATALAGADAGDYLLVNVPSVYGTILPRTVTLNANEAAASKIYDGTTVAALSGGPLNNIIPADSGGLSLVGTFASPNVGQHIGVAVALSGAKAANYVLGGNPALAANITAAPLTLTGTETVTPKTYDGTTVATLSGGILSGLAPVDQGLVSLHGTYASANVGSHIAVATALAGADAADYLLVNPPTLYGAITPRTVTLNANETAASKIYDGTTAATLSGGPLNNIIPADSGGLSLVGTFASPNVGQHIAVAVALSGAEAGNYLLGGSPVLAADITPAPLLATANRVSTSLGGVLPALSGTFSGFVDGQTLASLEAAGYQASWTSTVNAHSGRGYYAVSGAFDDANYQVVQAAGNATAFDATSAAPGGNGVGNVLQSIVSAALPGGGPFGAPGTGVGAGNGTSISGNGYAAAGNANGVAGAADGYAGATGGTQANNLANPLANTVVNTQVGIQGDTPIDAQGAGMNGSVARAVTGLSLGANTASTAGDGTVTLSSTGASAASAESAGGTSDGGTSDGGAAARGTRQAALTGYGGRRLIVIGGGVNASGAQ